MSTSSQLSLPLPPQLCLRPSPPRPLPELDLVSVFDAKNSYFYTPPGSECSVPPSPTSLSSSVTELTAWTDLSASPSLQKRHHRLRPLLRRRRSPRHESLRQLRTRDSEASLQVAYERQTLEYLRGGLPSPVIGKFSMSPDSIKSIDERKLQCDAEEVGGSTRRQSFVARDIELWRR